MTLVYDARCLIFKVAGMGPYDNNGYVIADPSTKEAYLVDAPAEIERLLNEAVDFQVKGVIVTHTHPDHVAGYADLKRLTDLPVAVHERDAHRLPGKPELLLAHDDTLEIGRTRIRVLHTPGHTPGALCLHADGALVSGDTLFPAAQAGPTRPTTSARSSPASRSVSSSCPTARSCSQATARTRPSRPQRRSTPSSRAKRPFRPARGSTATSAGWRTEGPLVSSVPIRSPLWKPPAAVEACPEPVEVPGVPRTDSGPKAHIREAANSIPSAP